MLVHFITDEPTKIPAIRAMLEPQYHIVPQLRHNITLFPNCWEVVTRR